MSVATIKHHQNSLLSISERLQDSERMCSNYLKLLHVILNNFKSKYILELINNCITMKIMYISNHFKSE